MDTHRRTLVRTHGIPGGEPRVSRGVWVTATSQCSFISPDRGLALPGMQTVGEAAPVWGRGPRGKPSAPPDARTDSRQVVPQPPEGAGPLL